ncbi:MAG: hypothetical protein ACFFCM_18735 [Promethearchaeota archaeon]
MKLPKPNIIYEGSLEGIVSSKKILTVGSYAIFLLKLEEKIEGIPEEIPVCSPLFKINKFVYIEEGDHVIIHGKFMKIPLFWKDDHYGMMASHIYNYTRKCGL